MATDMRNLYEVLGIGSLAEASEIRAAYRKRAKTLHPDIGGSAEAFSELQGAYAILSDPQKREQYDRDGTIDNQVNNERALIIEHVAKMLDNYMAQFVNGSDSVIQVDIVEAMRDQISDQIADISKAVAKMQSAAEKLEKFAERFSAKKGKSILRMAAEAKAAAIRGSIPIRSRELDKLEQVLELLDDQEFRFDPRPAQVFTQGGAIFGQHPFSSTV
jgi:curved DNA-binding protein CbpA